VVDVELCGRSPLGDAGVVDQDIDVPGDRGKAPDLAGVA
jgi:hypothetical protein